MLLFSTTTVYGMRVVTSEAKSIFIWKTCRKSWRTSVKMNEIKWHGDETIDDLYDYWIELVEAGNRAQLLRELSCAVNTGESAPVPDSEEHINTEGVTIRELAYGADVDKVIEIVKESDEHEVGENLK